MKKVLWVFLLGLAAQVAYGNGYQVMLQGNRVTAMGNTGTGLVQGGSSLFFNPGALGFLNSSELMIGVNPVFGRNNYVPSGGYEQYESRPEVFSGHAYYVWADSASKFRAGVGFFAPYGSTIEWEDGWIGQYQLTSLSLKAYFIQPTFAYKISDKLSVGAGVDIVIGGVNLQRNVPVSNVDGEPGAMEFDGKAKVGFGFNLGVFFMPSDKFSVGLNYRSEVTTKVEDGDLTFTVPTGVQGLFPNTTFNAELPLPSVLSVGLGFYPTEKLTLGVDVNYVGWSAYEALTFEFGDPIPALGGATTSTNARNYENTLIFHFGGEYKLNDMIDVRAGFYYDQSPVQDGYMTPETPDADAFGYTFGLGIHPSDKIALDLTFLYINKEQRENTVPTGVQTGGLNGTYKTSALIPGLGFTYRF
jgi:long-chain fatty acid transport protein